MQRIAIVDDSTTTLAVLRSLSAKLEDAATDAFSDPIEALTFLKSHPADVIIVDYSMPRMTGIELIKALRILPLHKETPIVMLTSSSELAVRNRAYEVGVTSFLTKPVRALDFRTCLSKFLKTRQAEATQASNEPSYLEL